MPPTTSRPTTTSPYPKPHLFLRLAGEAADVELRLGLVLPEPGQDMPATEPSALTTELYKAIEEAIKKQNPRAVVIPYMSRGATDGAILRAKAMAVYGVPVFTRDDKPSRAHGNDEPIGVTTLREGAALLQKIVEPITR